MSHVYFCSFALFPVMIHVKKNQKQQCVDNFGERLKDCLKYGAGEKCTVNSLTALGGEKKNIGDFFL